MLVASLFTKTKSLNSIINGINSDSKRFKNIFKKNEFIPKIHATRDCLEDIDYKDISNIHFDIVNKLRENKFFANHNYRGHNVVIADGVEFFETHKNIDGLHIRNHKDGSVGYYYKALGLMYLADDVDVMLDLVLFENYDVSDDTEHNDKIKSEGEITVFKKTVTKLKCSLF